MRRKNGYNPETVSHPGSTLHEKLKELGMGPKEFSVRVHKPEKTITAILNGNSSITPDMAVQFETVLKIPASFWMNRQRTYDEYKARVRASETIKAAYQWARGFPYAEMAKKGWVKTTRKIDEKVIELFNYFGISNHLAWESYYYEKKLLLDFRISLVHSKEPMAVSAWLRRGELQANKIDSVPFDKGLFKKSLNDIKSLMVTNPDNFFSTLQGICLKAGVKLIHTPCLPKAPVSGSTRWVGDNPIIQLSNRYKTFDKFWFTFFHEVGHILLHGKKYISLEDVKFEEEDQSKEAEANLFAIKWTFSEKEESEFMDIYTGELEQIEQFAREIGTHPGMIVGRLHFKKFLPYNIGNEYCGPIEV